MFPSIRCVSLFFSPAPTLELFSDPAPGTCGCPPQVGGSTYSKTRAKTWKERNKLFPHCLGGLSKLDLMQPPIDAGASQELIVSPQVHDSPRFHDHDSIRQGQGGQAMRDNHGRSMANELLQHF